MTTTMELDLDEHLEIIEATLKLARSEREAGHDMDDRKPLFEPLWQHLPTELYDTVHQIWETVWQAEMT